MLEVEQAGVGQLRGGDVLDRGKDALHPARVLLVPAPQHVLHRLALQVLLGAAQVAGNNRILLVAREFDDVLFPAVGQRADHHVTVVVAAQLGRHGFHLAAEKHVQEQGFHDVVTVVAEGDLVGADLLGEAVQAAAPQARAQAAGGFPLRHLLLDDGIGVLFQDVVVHPFFFQVFGQHMLREAGLLLVQVHRHQLEIHRRGVLQIAQNLQHGVGILAAGQAHHHLVAVLDHVEVGDRPAGLAAQLLLQLVETGAVLGVHLGIGEGIGGAHSRLSDSGERMVEKAQVTLTLRITRRYRAGDQRFK